MKTKLLICAALFATAAAFAAEMSPAAKALVKIDDEWSAVAGKKDAAKVASYYAEDGVAYAPNIPAVTGRAAAGKVWAEMLGDPNFVSISWKTLHAEVAASGELGVTTGTYEAVSKLPDGKTATEKGKYVCVWKKQKDGSWKASHDIWNADSK